MIFVVGGGSGGSLKDTDAILTVTAGLLMNSVSCSRS